MDFQNKKVCIIGYGKSGRAAAERLLSAGAVIKISESRDNVDGIRELPVEFEFGGHTPQFCCDADLIVVSPGVHLDIPAIEEAKKRSVPVISEIELAWRFFSKPVIAITGTNGKTTTTTLVGEMLKDAGFRVAVAGNIGLPLISVDDSILDYIVAEISSYQLETIEDFKPHIAVMLNLTPDHLERYKTMEAYGAAKQRVFMNQNGDDFFVFNNDDPLVVKMAERAPSKKVPFSRTSAVLGGLFLNEGHMVRLKENYLESIIRTDEILIKGDHNIENAMAAAQTALLCGVSPSDIAKTLKDFKGVEHRIEFVRAVNGVAFYNDSKGTNPDSTIVALKTLAKDRNIVLILGGRDKGTDLGPLCQKVLETVKEAVLIGEAADRFDHALRSVGYGSIHRASSMEEAVRRSFELSGDGTSVLLSPACASFDMFKDFEHRGKVFKEIVHSL